ncbi:MAG: hypothetical protein JWM64_2466 [Frankiales bacterium]|nr:hypothetical protein [Frankiales bacterium]
MGWRAVVALPALAALALPAAARLAPTTPRARGRLDLPGAALLALTAGSAVVLLQAHSTGLTRPTVLAVAVVALLALALLPGHARRRPDGFLPAAVVGDPAFRRYAFVGMSLFAGYLSMLFAAPLLLAQRQGWGPLQIGLALLPAAAAATLAARLAGAAAERRSERHVALALTLTSATGLIVAALVVSTAATVLGLAATVSAFAAGQVLLVGAVTRLVPAAVTGSALALFNFLFILGGSLGSAATGGLADALTLPGALALMALLPLGGAALSQGMSGEPPERARHHPAGTPTWSRKDPSRMV